MKRDPYLVSLGQRVVGARKARRWTQERLAERAEVGVQFVSELERGVINPSVLMLRQVAAALELSLARLLAERDETDMEIAVLLKDRTGTDRRRALVLLRALFVEV